MTFKEVAFKSEDAEMKAWQAASLATAIHEAIFSGSYDVKTYEGALFTLVRLVEDLRGEVCTLTGNLFEALRCEEGQEV